MKNTLVLLTCLLLGFATTAQFSNFNSQKNWSINKKEFIFGGGATQFLGDLGGQDGIGKDYSLADLNMRATNYNVMLGFRYRFHPNFATTSQINFGKYRASDFFTNNEGRSIREIDIKSTLISIYQRYEYIFFANEKIGRRNKIPGLNGVRDRNTQCYLYTGAGLAYYNPQGGPNSKYEGVSLRPLSTEGQGFTGGADSYKSVTAIVPFGLGYRIGLGRMWRVGLEATYFKTFTDYMDDVSTTYYSFTANQIQTSPEAIYFSNPSENWTIFQNGDKRGDKQKDAYFYLNLFFSKNITYKSYVRGKEIKWNGVRAKF
jgi:hypothetical protein